MQFRSVSASRTLILLGEYEKKVSIHLSLIHIYWEQLLSTQRYRTGKIAKSNGKSDLRSEFEKDYHRIIGSASFRRLQDKTQVLSLIHILLIQGHDILKEPELAKKSIGYLPEQPPVYMDMTVREYLQFAAELKKIPKKEREKQMNDVIRMTGIREVENRLIQNLSKGYRQRVGLAQAILGFPEVIILDEPTVGLDPKQIIEIRELIRKLSKKHTIILSSHILAEIREVCDYIMIISRGKLVASDTPENLENRLKSSRHIELQAKAPVTRVQEILKEVSGIKKVDYRKDNNLMTTCLLYTSITNGKFSKAEMNKIASMTRNAYARCINPVGTLADGDTIYAASVGDVEADINVAGTLAAQVMERAIVNAIHAVDVYKRQGKYR